MLYTLGLWRAKPGLEQEFVAAWEEMAARTAAEFESASAVLLRDRADPALFISSGPWESLAQIEQWRQSTVFRDGVAKMRPLLESFEPHTMDPVAVIEDRRSAPPPAS